MPPLVRDCRRGAVRCRAGRVGGAGQEPYGAQARALLGEKAGGIPRPQIGHETLPCGINGEVEAFEDDGPQ